MHIPVLIISGTMGAGKSTVLGEIHDVLVERNVPHAAIDFDALSISWPVIRDAPFNSWIGFENLRVVWANYAAVGLTRLVVASVVETREELLSFELAIPGAAVQVCRLVAATETLLSRLRIREPGTFQPQALARAPVLAQILAEARIENFVIDNDGRGVREVAEEILARAGWA